MSLAIHATTVLGVRVGERFALGGDGQVTLGETVLEPSVLYSPSVLEAMTTGGVTGAVARISTVPAFISSASSFRPVGLIRSPITTKGRPKPITTSFEAELTTVSVIDWVSIW